MARRKKRVKCSKNEVFSFIEEFDGIFTAGMLSGAMRVSANRIYIFLNELVKDGKVEVVQKGKGSTPTKYRKITDKQEENNEELIEVKGNEISFSDLGKAVSENIVFLTNERTRLVAIVETLEKERSAIGGNTC